MINGTIAFYQERLAISQEITERIAYFTGLVEKLDSAFEPDKLFMSDYLVGEEREWKHLYFFSKDKIWIAHKFLASTELEMIPFSSTVTFQTQLSIKSFDLVTYNDKSRFSVTIQINKAQLELKATQANCMILLDIVKNRFINFSGV